MGLIILFGFAIVKKYTLTEGQAVINYNILEKSKKAIMNSPEISMKEGIELLKGIDSIQGIFLAQSKDTTYKN